MKTYPDMNFYDHVNRLVERLNKFFPGINSKQFLFYDAMKNDSSVLRSDLFSQDEFLPIFNQLCDEGHEWINLAGDSWFNDNFIISVEYSQKVSMAVTAVNIAGPTLDIGRTLLQKN